MIVVGLSSLVLFLPTFMALPMPLQTVIISVGASL